MSSRQWMCVFVLWAFAQQPPPPSLAGEWLAAIGSQHVRLRVEQAPGSPMKGTFVDVEAKSEIALDTLTIDVQRTVAFAIAAAGATFDGKLSADGSEIAGTIHQGGAAVPVVFRRPGAAAAPFTLKPTTKGTVALQPCRSAGDAIEGWCGHYEVFENRQARTGRKIALNIFIVPARAEMREPDPFFALAGGPGQGATEAFPQAAYVRTIAERRDVVLVDQRGTGKSNPLDCTLLSVDNPQEVLGAPYSLDRIRSCRADSDRKADTTQYTTSIAADDLDEVRAALGYGRVNVLGGSYGTKAALVYLRRHGEHVRTLTLEAVAPPDFLIPCRSRRASRAPSTA